MDYINYQGWRTSDKGCMRYKIRNGLVDKISDAGPLEPGNRSSRGHRYQPLVSHSRTDTDVSALALPAVWLKSITKGRRGGWGCVGGGS